MRAISGAAACFSASFDPIAIVLIHLPDELEQAIDHAGPAGDQQRVSLLVMRHAAHADAVVELAQYRRNVFGRDIAQRYHAHHHFIPFGDRLTAVLCQRGSFSLFGGDHLQDVIGHADDRIAIDIQHVEKELVILLLVELFIAAHRDLTFHRRIDNDGFAQVLLTVLINS